MFRNDFQADGKARKKAGMAAISNAAIETERSTTRRRATIFFMQNPPKGYNL
jgi:hypothetical protein